PPVIDRSDVLGLPAVEHRRGSTRYSECEPCRSCFGRNPYVHPAPPPTVRPAQWRRAASCMLNVATSSGPPCLKEQSIEPSGSVRIECLYRHFNDTSRQVSASANWPRPHRFSGDRPLRKPEACH